MIITGNKIPDAIDALPNSPLYEETKEYPCPLCGSFMYHEFYTDKNDEFVGCDSNGCVESHEWYEYEDMYEKQN